MKYIFIIYLLLTFISCEIKTTGNPERFKLGTFEIPAENGYSNIKIIRKDSIQIQSYTIIEKKIKRIDTLFITWKNNFAYRLQMKSPKTDLDKDLIFVQITKVRDSSYDFSSRIGYSKFTTPGTVFISK